MAFKVQTKIKLFFLRFCCLLLFEDTFISVFKDKKPLRSHKKVETKVFLSVLLDEGCGSGFRSVQIMTDPDPGGPKTYGSESGSTTLARVNGKM
jgi:hypothetical protein